MNAHFIDNISSFLTNKGVDFVTVACEDQNGDLNLHHFEREGTNDGLPSNYVSELTRGGVIIKPDIFDREWKGAENTITERRFVRVYQILRNKDEKVVISGSMTLLAELPNGLLGKLDNYIYKYASSQ